MESLPIYQYKCPKCNRITEEYSQIVHDNQTIDCAHPDCVYQSHRIISLSHFQFSDGMPSYKHDEGGVDSLDEAQCTIEGGY